MKGMTDVPPTNFYEGLPNNPESEYTDFRMALRTLSHCHVRVTHPDEFLRYSGDLLTRLHKSSWVYTGAPGNSPGWTPLKDYMDRAPGPTAWEPIGPVGLSEALRAVGPALYPGTQCFFFVPNGDLLFSDPVNAANFTSFAQHLLRFDKYSTIFISYGHGPLNGLSGVMADLDERPNKAQTMLGVANALTQFSQYELAGYGTKEDTLKFLPYFSGMTRMQVWRITNEMVIRAKKVEGRKLSIEPAINFRASLGLPPIEPPTDQT